MPTLDFKRTFRLLKTTNCLPTGAAILLWLLANTEKDCNGTLTVTTLQSRIADETGLSNPTVGRSLKTMQEKRIIKVDRTGAKNAPKKITLLREISHETPTQFRENTISADKNSRAQETAARGTLPTQRVGYHPGNEQPATTSPPNRDAGETVSRAAEIGNNYLKRLRELNLQRQLRAAMLPAE